MCLPFFLDIELKWVIVLSDDFGKDNWCQNYYFREISGHVDSTYSFIISVPSFQVSSVVDENCILKSVT